MKRQKIDILRLKALTMPILLLGCTLLTSIALIEQLPSQHFFWSSLRDSGHTFVFFQANLLALYAINNHRHAGALRVCAVTLGVFVAGLIVELLQPVWGRQASLLDAWYNLLGCIAAACWFMRGTLLPTMTACVIAALLCLCSLIQPLIYALEYQQQQTRLPLLIDFSSHLNRLYWQASSGSHANIVSPPEQWSDAPAKVARLDMLHGRYPGIRFRHFHANWSRFERLRIQVWHNNPTTLAVTLRIHDPSHNGQYEDRFNRQFALPPGESWIDISLADIERAPEDRRLNRHAIAAIGLFTTAPEEPQHLYLGEMRLATSTTPAR